MDRNANRVGITGLGVVAPNGTGITEFWRTLLAGKSGIGRITHFDASELKAQIAGEVNDFEPLDYVPERLKPKRMARQAQFAIAATKMALEDACLDLKAHSSAFPIDLVMGSSIAALDLIRNAALLMEKRGMAKATPTIVSSATAQSSAAAVAEFLGVPASVKTVSTTCASGLDAIGLGMTLIQQGKAEIVIAGGTDCPISPMPFASMAAGGFCATRNDEPEKASRPFDKDRETGVISEGCGVVILENIRYALGRGRTPYAELSGYATEMDSEADRPGSGYKATMSKALANAGRRTTDVDWLQAWAPGTPLLDRVETEVIKDVFGAYAYEMPVSSIKGVIGNPFGATGAIMTIATALAFRDGVIPHTVNCDEPSPECDLDYVQGQPRKALLGCALINAHGVGGGNSSLVITKFERNLG
jgi:3-oxoacyl-[acyl-carrier-protein] synthase II